MTKRKKPDELNQNERLFCIRYVEYGRNGTRAYRSVWTRARENTAATGAYRLLRKPEIQNEIQKVLDFQIQKAILSKDQVIAELCRIGAYDISEIIDPETGRMLPLRSMPENVRRAIKSIKRDRNGQIEVTFHDKSAPLTTLAKITGALKDSLEIKGKLRLEDLVARSHEEDTKND